MVCEKQLFESVWILLVTKNLCVLMASRPVFMIFDALQTGMKFIDFHNYSGAHTDPVPRHARGDFVPVWVPNKHLSILFQSREAINMVLSIEAGKQDAQY